MTHERNPIGSDDRDAIAGMVAARHRSEGRGLAELAAELAAGDLLARAAGAGEDMAAPDDVVADLVARARVLLDRGGLPGRVDEASIESFPASDAPAWIGGKPRSD